MPIIEYFVARCRYNKIDVKNGLNCFSGTPEQKEIAELRAYAYDKDHLRILQKNGGHATDLGNTTTSKTVKGKYPTEVLSDETYDSSLKNIEKQQRIWTGNMTIEIHNVPDRIAKGEIDVNDKHAQLAQKLLKKDPAAFQRLMELSKRASNPSYSRLVLDKNTKASFEGQNNKDNAGHGIND